MAMNLGITLNLQIHNSYINDNCPARHKTTIMRLLLVGLLLIISSSAQAQLKQGYKALKKGDYDLAIKAFEVDIFHPKGELAIEAEHQLAKIYFATKYEHHNLEQAYEYAKSALNRLEKLDNNSLKKAQKKGLGLLTLENHKRQIVNAAYTKVTKEDNYKAYQDFLQKFDGPTPIQFDKATQWRNQRGLDDAQKINTFNAYEHLYKKHYESINQYNPSVDTTLQLLMFESFMRDRGWQSYDQFANLYPNNLYIKDNKAAKDFRPIANSQELENFRKFMIGHPNSLYKKLAIDYIYELTMNSQNIEYYDYFVRNHPKYPKIQELWEQFYHIFSQKTGNQATEEFEKNYPNNPITKNK